jgi:hypothetical protein
MHRQSSRAEITPWSFDNEYHFGDFRGNALEMPRRGYDIHLHYANFGIRKLMIRLPRGFPDPAAAKQYLNALEYIKDKAGPGGVLSIDPEHEPGDLDDLWDLEELLDRLAPLRAEIMDGDLRPLYLAHLVLSLGCYEDRAETREAPVPAGLVNLTGAQFALAELYQLSPALIRAAGQESSALPAKKDSPSAHIEWLQAQPEEAKIAWLERIIAGADTAAVRGEILDEFRKANLAPPWPTKHAGRTIAELETAAEEIQQQQKLNPAKHLGQTEELLAERSTDAYQRLAALLADLRDALAGTDRADLPKQHAQKLRKQHPTRKHLISELRKQGF